MHNQRTSRYAHLNTGTGTTAHLRTSLYAAQTQGIRVDPATGVISDVAVMTIGDAKGHGFSIDATTLEQVRSLIASCPDGAQIRYMHPETKADGSPSDGTLTMVGRLKNPRIVGNAVRGDIYLGKYAATVPGKGDVRSYLLGVATEDPAAIGLSAVIDFDREPILDGAGRPQGVVARVFQVFAVDFTEDPAANPRGLLASGALPGIPPVVPPKGAGQMTYLEYLISLGLDANASAEQIAAFVAKLTAEQQAKAKELGYKDVAMAAGSAAAAGTSGVGAAGAVAAGLAAGNTTNGNTASLSTQTSDVVALEARRVSQIETLAATYKVDAGFAGHHIALGTTPQEFITKSREHLAAKFRQPEGAAAIRVGDDQNIASLAGGLVDHFRLAGGNAVKKPHERTREFSGMTLAETCRAYLSKIGVNTDGMSRAEICSLPFNRGRLAHLARAQLAHTPGDFSNILLDATNVIVRDAYEEEPSTWEMWARATTAPDFKNINNVQMSEAPNLAKVGPGGEYKDGKFTDSKETYKLYKYGRIVTITWETMMNDNRDVLGRIPQAMGRAARRLEGDLVYYVLLNNAAMSDTGTLFNTTALTTDGGHANLASASAVISVAALNILVAQMAVQVDLNKKVRTPVIPQFLLVPPAVSGTAWEITNSTTNPSSTNANVKNRFAAGGQVPLQAIVEPRLQTGVSIEKEDGNLDTVSGSSTAWFLAASANRIDTVELARLESEPAPVTTEEDGFRVDGRQYKVRHVAAAKAIDYRGLAKNAGA